MSAKDIFRFSIHLSTFSHITSRNDSRSESMKLAKMYKWAFLAVFELLAPYSRTFFSYSESYFLLLAIFSVFLFT